MNEITLGLLALLPITLSAVLLRPPPNPDSASALPAVLLLIRYSVFVAVVM